MAKTSGLGDNLYVGGYNLSGDIGSLSRIGGSITTQDVTGIDKYGFERIGLGRDGGIEFTSFFNGAAGQATPVLKTLPTADVVVSYFRGTAIGNPVASLVGKQINYDPTRADDGSLTFNTQALANGYGLEWGDQLTAGLRTDTAATNGTSFDTGSSLAFGAQAYLQVAAFTGTDVTIKIQDSADNVSFTDVTSFAFTQVTAAPFTQRIAIGNTATVRRYLRASTVTTGGVTSVTFAVQVTKNAVAGQVF
jgi:hypothetical protein